MKTISINIKDDKKAEQIEKLINSNPTAFELLLLELAEKQKTKKDIILKLHSKKHLLNLL